MRLTAKLSQFLDGLHGSEFPELCNGNSEPSFPSRNLAELCRKPHRPAHAETMMRWIVLSNENALAKKACQPTGLKLNLPELLLFKQQQLATLPHQGH